MTPQRGEGRRGCGQAAATHLHPRDRQLQRPPIRPPPPPARPQHAAPPPPVGVGHGRRIGGLAVSSPVGDDLQCAAKLADLCHADPCFKLGFHVFEGRQSGMHGSPTPVAELDQPSAAEERCRRQSEATAQTRQTTSADRRYRKAAKHFSAVITERRIWRPTPGPVLPYRSTDPGRRSATPRQGSSAQIGRSQTRR
jgi:hypothetical protein